MMAEMEWMSSSARAQWGAHALAQLMEVDAAPSAGSLPEAEEEGTQATVAAVNGNDASRSGLRQHWKNEMSYRRSYTC